MVCLSSIDSVISILFLCLLMKSLLMFKCFLTPSCSSFLLCLDDLIDSILSDLVLIILLSSVNCSGVSSNRVLSFNWSCFVSFLLFFFLMSSCSVICERKLRIKFLLFDVANFRRLNEGSVSWLRHILMKFISSSSFVNFFRVFIYLFVF